MKGIRLLFQLRRNQLKNKLYLLVKKGRLRFAAIVVTMLIIGLALFWGFYRSFIFLGGFLGVGDILIERLIYLLSLALFLMLIFSNAVISFQLHYKARETDYLHTLPLPFPTVFWFLLLEAIFLSTWATLFLVLPTALAYGLTHQLPFYSYLTFPLFSFCLAALAALLGSLGAFLFIRWLSLPRKPRAIIAFLFILLALFLTFRARLPGGRAEAPDQQTHYINKLLGHTRATLNPLLPSFWAAEGFLQGTKGRTSRSLGFLAVLLVNTVFLWQVVDFTAGGFYHRIWALYQSRGKRVRKERSDRRKKLSRSLFFFLPAPVRALLIKDGKIFIREPAQWIQGAILFGLLIIYIFNIKNMPTNVYQPFWKNLITFFNLGASSLILATLTTRFVFPSLSLEGKTFWVLGLAPFRRTTLFRVKLVSNLIGALIATETLMILSNHILEVSGLMMAVTCGAVFLMALVLVSLAMGLGAVFPDFKQDNPARISAGFGGTLNLILSLIYIALTVGSLAFIFHLRAIRPGAGFIIPSGKFIFAGMTIVVLLSFLGIYFPLKLGMKALKRLEF